MMNGHIYIICSIHHKEHKLVQVLNLRVFQLIADSSE